MQLRRDKTEKESFNEEDQVYYLEEAIAFCESQLEKQLGQLTSLSGHHDEGVQVDSENEHDTYIDPKLLNKAKSMKK